MNSTPSDGVAPDGDRVEGWPARIAGVVETVVATEGPDGRWNHAALGLSPPDGTSPAIEPTESTPATARTFGRTRTRRNFGAGRDAYVQFTRDPVDFVDAALSTYETDAPILATADAWTKIDATERAHSEDRGTEIHAWSLQPIEAAVRERVVPTTNRGRSAVIEATVAASRLDVDGYDEGGLLDRLQALAEVVESTGDGRSRIAFERIDEHMEWRDDLDN